MEERTVVLHVGAVRRRRTEKSISREKKDLHFVGRGSEISHNSRMIKTVPVRDLATTTTNPRPCETTTNNLLCPPRAGWGVVISRPASQRIL